jgi:hypothetical protein
MPNICTRRRIRIVRFDRYAVFAGDAGPTDRQVIPGARL